jgi:hypothetical protein
MLIVAGALGFKREDGRISRWLEDLPESGDVEVVLLPPPLTTDVLAQSGGSSGGEARRDKLTVIVPGRGSYKLADVGQDDLERFLDVVGNVWLRDRRWQSR